MWFKKPDVGDSVAAGNPRQTGWPMHECCYTLMYKCFGQELFETNLPRLMQVLTREHLAKINDYLVNGPANPRSGAYEVALRDPLYIPELNDIVTAAVRRAQRARENNGPDYMGVMTPGKFVISPGAIHKVPLDIALEITQYLSGRELRCLMLAASWRFPSIYWKERLPQCLFEIHEDIDGDEFDWQYFALEYTRVMERPNGIHHRLTIVHYLARIYGYLSGESEMNTSPG